MTTTENSRADALTGIGQFLTDAVTAAGLLSHGRTDKKLAMRISEQADELRKHIHLLAASPVEQPAADVGRRILWGRSDYERLLDAMLRAQIQGWSGDHMTRAENMLGCYPHPNAEQPSAAPIEKCAGCHSRCTNNPPDCYAAPSPADERAALQWTAGTLQEIVSGRWNGAKESDKVSIGSVTKTVAQVLDMADAALGRAASANETAAEAVAIPVGYALVPMKITDAMIESAMEHHYGKRRVRQHGGAAGIAMTVNEHDWSGVDAMHRFWKGALAAAPQPAQADARVGLTDEMTDTLKLAIGFIASSARQDRGEHVARIRALLAAHPGQPERRAEVTDAMIEAAAFAYDTFPCPYGESVGRGPHHGQLRATLQAAIDAARTGASS